MSKNSSSGDKSTIGINNEFDAELTYHNNVDQNIITITEDKLELILRDKIKEREAKESWNKPLGIFVSLMVTQFTTDKFKDFLFIPAIYAEVSVNLAILASFIWLLISFIKLWKYRHASIKNIIKAIKSPDKEIDVNVGFFKKFKKLLLEQK